jgi:uncharacterized protein DUF3788
VRVNAFIGQPAKPSEVELAAVLGPAKALWDTLIANLANVAGVSTQEWKSISAKYGWSLSLKRGQRVIVYLSPSNDCFTAGFVLGKRAVQAAHASKLPAKVVQAIDQAPRYAEGTGVRLVVSGARDLAVVQKLARIKLEN